MNCTITNAFVVKSGLQSLPIRVFRDNLMVLTSTYSPIDKHTAKVYNYTIEYKEDTYAQNQPEISR